MPRQCSYFKVDGIPVIACGGTKIQACVKCGKIANLLCDWKMKPGTAPELTCDAPICDSCGTSVGPDKDLCPSHAYAWANHLVYLQGELAL